MPGLDSFVKFLLLSNTTNGSTTFADSSGLSKAITQPALVVTHTTAQILFGSTTVDLTGAVNGYLEIASDADFNFGTGDFCIDLYAKFASTAGIGIIIEDPGVWRLFRDGTYLKFEDYAAGLVRMSGSGATDVGTTTFHHIAIIRTGTWLRLWVDGENSANLTTYSASLPYSGNPLRIGADSAGANRLAARLQNIRISKGIARFTNDYGFNPQASLYSASALPTTQGGEDGFCQLLVHSDTIHSCPILKDSSPKNRIVNKGNTYTYHSTAATQLGCFSVITCNFSSYLTVTVDEDLSLFDRDFTLEGRIYCGNFANKTLFDAGSSSGAYGYFFRINASNQVEFGGYGFTSLVTTVTLTNSTWYHVAVVRQGTSIKIYINGIEQAATTSSYSFVRPANNYNMYIGCQDNLSNYWDGYFTELRISIRYARWTAPFTPPTARYDAGKMAALVSSGGGVAGGLAAVNLSDKYFGADSYNILLVHSNTTDGSTTFKDSSPANRTLTPTSVTHDTDLPYLGSTSIKFAVASNRLRAVTPSTDFNFGTGDFTIEFWINISSLAQQTFLDQGQWFFELDSSGDLNFRDGSGSGIIIWGIASPALNTWQHVCLVRAGSSFVMYLQGVQVRTFTNANALGYSGSYGISIGANNAGTMKVTGYMTEIRLSKGKARYLQAFTPQTRAFGTIEMLGGGVAGGTAIRNPVNFTSSGGAVAGGSAKARWHFAAVDGGMQFYGEAGVRVDNVAIFDGGFPLFYGDIDTGGNIDGVFSPFYGEATAEHRFEVAIDGGFAPFFGDVSVSTATCVDIDGGFAPFYGDISTEIETFADIDGGFPPFYGDMSAHDRFYSIDGGFAPFYGDVRCEQIGPSEEALAFLRPNREAGTSPLKTGNDSILSFVRGSR